MPVSKEVTVQFRWRSRKGVFHLPEEMETHHLFYTILMIWNHSVPPELRIGRYTRYEFGRFYSPEYMADAVRHLARELVNRKDLTPYFIECLCKIQAHLTQLPEPKGGAKDGMRTLNG